MKLTGYECDHCGKQVIIRRQATSSKPPEGWLTHEWVTGGIMPPSMVWHFCSIKCQDPFLTRMRDRRIERMRRKSLPASHPGKRDAR